MSTKYSENEESEAALLLLGRRVTQNTLQETQIKVGKWVISSGWSPTSWVKTIQQSKRKVTVKTPAVVRATGVLKTKIKNPEFLQMVPLCQKGFLQLIR